MRLQELTTSLTRSQLGVWAGVNKQLKMDQGDFPDGPVAKTPCSQCRGSLHPAT